MDCLGSDCGIKKGGTCRLLLQDDICESNTEHTIEPNMYILPTDAPDIVIAFSVPTYAENDSVEAPYQPEIQSDQLVRMVGHIEAHQLSRFEVNNLRLAGRAHHLAHGGQ